MEPEQIRKLNQWLQSKVSLDEEAEEITIRFDQPSAEDFLVQGFDEGTINLTLRSPWWGEMVTDIVETPDFAEPGESPEEVLGYARDLVVEYVAKRLNPY